MFSELCSQSGLQEVKKRKCLHMHKRITLATHKIQKHIQAAHNCIQYSSWKCSMIPRGKITEKTIS